MAKDIDMVLAAGNVEWAEKAPAMVLVLIRVSTVIALSPFFGSRSFPVRSKAVFCLLVSWLILPVAISNSQIAAPRFHDSAMIGGSMFTQILGEIAVGVIYGLCLGFFNEMLLIAGQIIGLQFSFSLVNLLDPASEIQTPLMGDLLQLGGTLILIQAGFDRVILGSIFRSFQAVPAGSFPISNISSTSQLLVPMLSGSFFAALQMAAPVLAATVLVEVSVALLGKLSPQLPVMALTVPLKTLTGFTVLIGSLAVWPRFLEARFSSLLDVAEKMIAQGARG